MVQHFDKQEPWWLYELFYKKFGFWFWKLHCETVKLEAVVKIESLAGNTSHRKTDVCKYERRKMWKNFIP